MQTLRRELRNKLFAVLTETSTRSISVSTEVLANMLADAALEVKGIANSQLLRNADPAWQIAAGLSSEDISKHNEREAKERAVANLFEECMGYPPLSWWTDPSLKDLLKFLLKKPESEIRAFARWSRADYSSFTPTKARQHPRLVMDLWLQANPIRNDSELKRPPVDPNEDKYVPAPPREKRTE